VSTFSMCEAHFLFGTTIALEKPTRFEPQTDLPTLCRVRCEWCAAERYAPLPLNPLQWIRTWVRAARLMSPK
jgi:hypothetical protein